MNMNSTSAAAAVKCCEMLVILISDSEMQIEPMSAVKALTVTGARLESVALSRRSESCGVRLQM